MPGTRPGMTFLLARRKRVGGGGVENTQLYPLLPLPAVDGKRTREVHGLAARGQERLAERTIERAKRDRVERATVAGAQPHPHMRVADRIGIGDGVRGKSEDRLRIARTEGPGALDRL